MSTINSILNNNANYTKSTNSDKSAQTVAAETTNKTTQKAATKAQQGLDSYISSQAVSLADYIGKDSDSSSSGLYSVLTYGQQGTLDLICNKVSGSGASSTATKKSATLADYLSNNSNDTDLFSVLTSDQQDEQSDISKKTVSLADYLK